MIKRERLFIIVMVWLPFFVCFVQLILIPFLWIVISFAFKAESFFVVYGDARKTLFMAPFHLDSVMVLFHDQVIYSIVDRYIICFTARHISDSTNNQQIRLRQTESIVEVSTNGDSWAYSNTVPINSVIDQKRVVTPTQKKVMDVMNDNDEDSIIVTEERVVDSDLNGTSSTSPSTPKSIQKDSLIDVAIQKDGMRPTRSPRANMSNDDFSRHPVNTNKRNAYNDVLVNINFKTPKYPSKIDKFSQSYSLYYYQNNTFIQQESPQIQPCLIHFIL